jgi:hypothetical protein
MGPLHSLPGHSFDQILREAYRLGNGFYNSLKDEQAQVAFQDEYDIEQRIELLSSHAKKEDFYQNPVDEKSFYLIYALWHDKNASIKSLAEKIKATSKKETERVASLKEIKATVSQEKKYRELQAKKDISKEARRRINAGLLLILIKQLNLDEADKVKNYIKDNKFDLSIDEVKSFIPQYVQAQYALAHYHERSEESLLHRVIDKLLASSYAVCSGIMKATSTVVLCITLAIAPPVWVAIPLFAILIAVINLNLYGRMKTSTFATVAGLSTLALGGLAMSVLFFPLAPWFYISIMAVVGFVAAMQSFQSVTNMFHQSRKQAKHGGILQEILYKHDDSGDAVPMSKQERLLIWGICGPISFTSALVFTFIGYQGLMFFVLSMPFLAVFAAMPAAPFIIFGFVLMMQIFSSITAFRFTKSAFINFSDKLNRLAVIHDEIIKQCRANHQLEPSRFSTYASVLYRGFSGRDEVKYNGVTVKIKGFKQHLGEYLSGWRNKPIQTFFKTLTAGVLLSIATLYAFVGARVSSVSFMIFADIDLNFVNRAIGLVAGLILTVPIQSVFATRSNVRLYDLVLRFSSYVKSKFSASKEQMEPEQAAEVRHALQDSEKVFNRIDTTRSTTNMMLNVLGKAAQKMNPHTPVESIPNIIIEAINSVASGLLGIKTGREQRLFDKDVTHIQKVVNVKPCKQEEEEEVSVCGIC